MDFIRVPRKDHYKLVNPMGKKSDPYFPEPKIPPKAHTRQSRSLPVRKGKHDHEPSSYYAINREFTEDLPGASSMKQLLQDDERKLLERFVGLETENKNLAIENLELKEKLVKRSQELEVTLQSWITAENELGKLAKFIQMRLSVHRDSKGYIEGEECAEISGGNARGTDEDGNGSEGIEEGI